MNFCGQVPAFQRSLLLLVACLAGVFLFAPQAYAQTGMISASPQNCTIPGGSTVCTSMLSWTSSGTTALQVWLSVNGGTEVEFGSSGGGGYSNDPASWIQASTSYVFNLYDYSSGSRGSLLSSTTVTGSYSISLSWGNSSDSAITPNMVALDYWTITISGAPASAPIVLTSTYDGGTPYNYTLGYTTVSGTYSQTAQVTSSSVGTYTNSWAVGGIAAGPPQYDYEIIFTPTALSVYAMGTATPNCGSTPTAGPYGVVGSVTYQIKTIDDGNVTEQNGNIPMEPYFDFGDGKYTVGRGSTTYWPSSFYANTSNGRFLYIPIGICGTGTFAPYEFTDETLYIGIGSVYYTVRSQSWTGYSDGYEEGEIQNTISGGGSDVTILW